MRASEMIGHLNRRWRGRDFWYPDDDEARQYVTMSVEEFITAVIGHIPDKQFKMVKNYGIYARNQRGFFRKLLDVDK